MKRIINFRYFFILALFMIVCSYALTNIFYSVNSKIIFLILLISFILLISILSISLKTKKIYIVLSILIMCFSLTTNMIIRQNKNNLYQNFENKNSVVYGRICSDYSFVNESTIRFEMNKISFIDSDKNQKIDGKVYVYSNAYKCDLSKLEKGRYISFLAEIDVFELNGSRASFLSNGYIANIKNIDDDITVSNKFHLTNKEKLKDFIFNRFENFNIKNSDIAFAMIFGDSEYIDEKIEDIFRLGGITHLLAVSGLNITILISVFIFIFKKLKINKKISFFLNIFIIFIYSYLCDFTPSVVRASLMAIIKMIADLRYKPYDSLSSLSLSACLILLINPLKLYNFSFILSYFAVFVIIILQIMTEKLLNKFFYKKFSNMASLNLSVGFGISVLQLYMFGQLPLLSIIVNFVSVPIVLYAFIYLLIMLFVTFVFPFLSFMFKIFDFLISIVIKFSAWINSLGMIIYYQNLSILLVIIFIFFIFNISPYVFQKKEVKYKQILIMIILALIIQTKMIF